MNSVMFYDCYNFNKEWYLVEMFLDIKSSEIDWSNIVVPEENLKKSDWQCAFMEQYLNEKGTEKLCETYDEPKEDIKPCRVTFFIYKGNAKILHTPYGDFELSDMKEMPDRLNKIIEFEDED